MLVLSFKARRFLVLFRELSSESQSEAVKEMVGRLLSPDISNDNAVRKERDFLVD